MRTPTRAATTGWLFDKVGTYPGMNAYTDECIKRILRRISPF